jgi:Zn-dependent protease
MDLNSGFVLGRIRGIAIRVHWSWVLIFVLVAWSLADGIFKDLFTNWTVQERWTAGGITAVVFFLSVLLHELSHAFVAQSLGMTVPSITLFIFGGVSSLGEEMKTAGQEFKVAIAGPLMSWVLAVIFAAFWLLFRGNDIATISAYLAWINFVLGAFNLLPGFPLDGGRVFRSIVWSRTHSLVRATRIASRVGTSIAWVMIAAGVITVIFANLFGLWYVLIGLFLKSASEGAYQQMVIERSLEHIRARDVMRAPPDPVGEQWTLQRIVDERVLSLGERCVLVGQDGAVTGILTTSDLTKVPREHWAETAARAAMVPAEQVVVVAPDASVLDAMKLMQQHDVHQLPVLDQGRLVGLLTRADVIRQLELRSAFSSEAMKTG